VRWHNERMDFAIRQPNRDDASRIAELHVATWREAYSHLLPDGFFDDEHTQGRQSMWKRILDDDRDDLTVRVAERGTELIGFSMVGPSFGSEGQDLPRDRQLYSVYVLEHHHGTGVGQALLESALGTGPAMLWVAKENPRAIAFYRRNGFEFDGIEQIDPGAPSITDARMVR
jgi:ribosomal protein S18 acetylase RimI-like enzyme